MNRTPYLVVPEKVSFLGGRLINNLRPEWHYRMAPNGTSIFGFSCDSKTDHKVVEKKESLPEVSYDHVIPPSGPKTSIQIYVEKSVPVNPGALVDVIVEDTNPPRAIAHGANIVEARWKVPGPFQSPKYPAEGFVTISVSKDQAVALGSADTISIRPSKK